MIKLRNPEVRVDRATETVTIHVVSDGLPRYLAPLAEVSPVSAEECELALAWAERMEAALDNFVSEVRLIQQRMESTRAGGNWHDPADPSLGAGGTVEAYRG